MNAIRCTQVFPEFITVPRQRHDDTQGKVTAAILTFLLYFAATKKIESPINK
ncbi:hypothetical protein [Kaarinaea lacus]